MEAKRPQTGLSVWAAGVVALAALTLAVVGGASARTGGLGGGSVSQSVLAADPVQINFTLEGCRNDGSIVLPIAGKFVCPDTAYTTGNLGKGWNELDLVPHRVTLKDNGANQTYSFDVAGDYKNGSGTGTGWDVISDLVLNTAKSSASCSAATMGPQTITPSGDGVGGADQTIYRLVTITQQAGATCVYDYYQRLALGAHNFSGSSLQSNLWNQDLKSSGIGEKRLSLPVGEILPQSITKDMSASQGEAHTWSILKSAPATLGFGNTCDPANRSKPVSITVTWTKSAAAPNGDITITTNITATNPASRVVTVDVTDVIYDGATQTTQSTPTSGTNPASSGPVDVPANTTQLLFTHTITVASGSSFNDVATATYTDKETGLPIPGNTQATASADVESSGTTTNDTATIEDVESISGANLSYSVGSATGAGATGGDFNGYILGTHTTGSVTWDSAEQSGSNSVTFNKTVYVSQASNTSGTLSDTATVTGSDGFTASSPATVSLQPSAQVSLKIQKTIPNVLTGLETQSFTFHVFDSSDTEVATPTISFAAGDTTKSTTINNLSPDTYTVQEDTASGWAPQNDQEADITLPTCSGEVDFINTLNPANAKAVKVTQPTGSESGWEMILTGPGTPAGGEKVNTDGSGNALFTTQLQEGSYTITETLQSGWEQAPGSPSGECSFTVSYPANAGHLYVCTITNRKLATIIVKKVTNPSPDPTSTSFGFTAGGGLNPTSINLTNGGQQTYSGLSPKSGYSVAETVPAGWDLTSSTCDDGSLVSNIDVSPGETVTCTFTNRLRGKGKVIKTFSGLPPSGTQSVTFQLRQGASPAAAGSILESLTANLGNLGTLNFTTTLTPGAMYQMCEVLGPLGPGWTTTLGPPLYSVYNPSGDNSTVCTDFSVTAGQTKTFSIDNKPPPGGLAFTIGYWKNWSSCTGGGQKPVLDQTLLKFAIASGQSTHGDFLGLLYVDTCQEGVAILSKSTLTGKKMSSDPLFNMAAQLLAADLNVISGSGQCAASATAVNQGHQLLSKYAFNGNTYTPKLTAADATLANTLGTTLDKYNNNKLC